jgi:hypothetical protein
MLKTLAEIPFLGYISQRIKIIGEVAEWSKAHAWKACKPKGFQGSNPCLTAILHTMMKFIFPKNRIKKIFFYLTISFFVFSITTPAFACDPLGCLFGGHKQDTLILGEVVSSEGEILDTKIIFVFPQNKIKSLNEGDRIIVNRENGYPETVYVGKKYLMSLNQNDDFYDTVWGFYEITGNGYLDAKMVRNKSLDDKALEIFINSGGTETGFGFDYSGIVPVLIVNGEKIPAINIYWPIAGAVGVLVLVVGGVVLVVKKKK